MRSLSLLPGLHVAAMPPWPLWTPPLSLFKLRQILPYVTFVHGVLFRQQRVTDPVASFSVLPHCPSAMVPGHACVFFSVHIHTTFTEASALRSLPGYHGFLHLWL